jgi:hypothetical protein
LILPVLRFLLANCVLADDGTEPLQLGKRFVEAALGGGAVTESEGEKSWIEMLVVEGVQLQRQGAVDAPLAEGHLIEQHAFGLGLGLPFLLQLGAEGGEFFKIGAGEAFRAEVVLDSIAGRGRFAGLGARTGGGIRDLSGFGYGSIGVTHIRRERSMREEARNPSKTGSNSK